ncbi:MAG: hypothetical protein PHT07_22580 [Paludibacter sp.]|nr:hypothetical protein [Paludibacter sp.]
MKKFLLKNSFKFIYWSFILALCLVVFIRNYIDDKLIVVIINYYFWYSFGLASGVFVSGKIIEKYNKINNQQ